MKSKFLVEMIYNAALMRKLGILSGKETVKSALDRVTGAIFKVDSKLTGSDNRSFQEAVRLQVNSGSFIFGTPILRNAGRVNQVTAACTVLPIGMRGKHPNFEAFRQSSDAAMNRGIGTGYDLSDLDEPVDALLEFNSILYQITERMRKEKNRSGASMATLRCDHPRILDFINVKRNADFNVWRFNLSVLVTSDFMEAVKQDKSWTLRDKSGNAVGSIKARDLFKAMADAAHYCGEPGLLFKDRYEADNPTPQWEYKSTAPCAEIAMAPGDACQFSYLNLSSFILDIEFNWENFDEAIAILTRVLDDSVQTTLDNVPEELQLPLVKEKRRIGVGVMGFADLLIKLGIPYDDPRASQLANQISERLEFYSKTASIQLARERGPFPAYECSRYKDLTWLTRKMPSMDTKTSETRTEAPKDDRGTISQERWDALYRGMWTIGLRNAATTALPPTGASATIVNISNSIEPRFSLKDTTDQILPFVIEAIDRQITDEGEKKEILEYIQKKGECSKKALKKLPFLKTARQISPDAHLKVQAEFQKYLDEAISKTVNLPQATTSDKVLEVFKTAYDKGLKGITVFRDNCLSERKITHHLGLESSTFFTQKTSASAKSVSYDKKPTDGPAI